jgi:hypothetical protein
MFHVEHSVAVGQEEDAGLGVGDGYGGIHGESGREDGWGAGEEEELVGGSGCCGGYGGGHVVYGAEGDGVELAGFGHGFGSGGPDFYWKAQGADCLAEKGGLFVLGFGQGDCDFGAQEGDGETGEAGSAAEVEEGGGCRVEVAGGEEALAEVAADDLFGVADGGEVGAGVPLEEEIEVERELTIERGRRGVKKIGGEESGDLVGGHRTSLAGCSTWNIRLCDLDPQECIRKSGEQDFRCR